MDKEKLEGLKRVRKWVSDEIEQIETDLAEAEKPELRDGDYGTATYKGKEFAWHCDGTGRDAKCLRAYTSPTSPRWFEPSQVEDICVFGNVPDDLAAMSKDMTEFETKYGSETIYWGFSPQCKDLTFTTSKGTHIIRNSDFFIFIRNLQSLYVTMKRQKA